jgi:hypothetical protein
VTVSKDAPGDAEGEKDSNGLLDALVYKPALEFAGAVSEKVGGTVKDLPDQGREFAPVARY